MVHLACLEANPPPSNLLCQLHVRTFKKVLIAWVSLMFYARIPFQILDTLNMILTLYVNSPPQCVQGAALHSKDILFPS